MVHRRRRLFPPLLMCRVFWTALLTVAVTQTSLGWQWSTPDVSGEVTARHEATMVAHRGQLYLLGGRGVHPVDRFDPTSGHWTAGSPTPIEVHHCQAVSVGDAIYMVGAMNGRYPRETPLEKVVVYRPEQDAVELVHHIPPSRRRGAAGSAVYQDKIYVVGGITNGHLGGSVGWFDVYDPQTGRWEALPDAPHARDHCTAAVVGDRLYCIGGRQTSSKNVFAKTVPVVDVFDFKQSRWLPNRLPMFPTPRAGLMSAVADGKIYVIGGESGTQSTAHDNVEVLDPTRGVWRSIARLHRGRHGTGAGVIDGKIYVAAGCGNRGGRPELDSLERLDLDTIHNGDHTARRGETVTLQFEGPATDEAAAINPFTDFRLRVTFVPRGDGPRVAGGGSPSTGFIAPEAGGEVATIVRRGFYAADGRSAHTSADRGSIWQCRFAPPATGTWDYVATMVQGPDVALRDDTDDTTAVALPVDRGTIHVSDWPVNQNRSGVIATRDFRHGPRLRCEGHYYRLGDKVWLKAGANSPENLLAYDQFDGTERLQKSQRDGEGKTDLSIHSFSPHVDDWSVSDPVWSDGRGKSIIGAMNYLADTGMNSVYFLTMNIGGDGNDVWPFRSADQWTRFDCSKLDQWEILFEHMQRLGLHLHVITQETENERLMDDGDLGRTRRLYYNELIARFAHHPAITWNLGEENGPANFSPVGQSPDQQTAMANHFKANDPYRNTVLIHSHAAPNAQDHVLDPLIGKKNLDGTSLQVSRPADVHRRVLHWRRRSADSGHPWIVSMDEIGPASRGAVPDSDEPEHSDLRGPVLYGSLLGGAAGVEWYFGYKFSHHDLTAEDWRSRDALWRMTAAAVDRLGELPLQTMRSADDAIVAGDGYGRSDFENVWCFYLASAEAKISVRANDVKEDDDQVAYSVRWYDPADGELIESIDDARPDSQGALSLSPPVSEKTSDWLVVVRRQ